MFAPVDIAPLVYFRFVFGAIMFWEVLRYVGYGRIDRYYVRPTFFFKYYGAEWVHPWPGVWMHVHFAVLGLLALCIMFGLFYRLTSLLFFGRITYVFLLDQATYLNHIYLVCLISLVMAFLPAHRAVSLDAGMRPSLRSPTAPAWTLWLLRFLLAVPYVYGGIAKLSSDWLQGEPLREWLVGRLDFLQVGPFLDHEFTVRVFSYGGLLFDLLIVPMLFIPVVRWFGVAWATAFHLLNQHMFSIGIFPWLMLFATPVFFPPDYFRRFLRSLAINAPKLSIDVRPVIRLSARQKVTVALAGTFVAVQVLLPFRHWLYPGNPNWTEEGHRFAWHMKLRDKSSVAQFEVTDPTSGRWWRVNLEDYLSERQADKMPSRPDMILQFAHYLDRVYREQGYGDVEVRARVAASLNGRPRQLLIDPDVDLSAQPRNLRPAPWILPLTEPLPTALAESP